LLAGWFNLLVQPVIDLSYRPEEFVRWIVVPHGPLHALPLAALTDKDGKRLIERVALTTVPSANVWLEMQRSRPSKPINMVTVGDAGSSDGRGPAALTNCLLESDAIIDLFRGVPSLKQLRGPAARLTETWDALRSAELAHIAAHGAFSLKEPRNDQAVLLSGDPTGVAALDAWQIRKGDLSGLRLLFLNICNGATCRYGPGGEPMGLLDAALVAGVENTIGGMWDLPDAEAMLFAKDFFLSFGENGFDPSKSLRSAMMNAIAHQRSLGSWAGYQLVGPGRPLASVAGARMSAQQARIFRDSH
jgi:CHAT domain-containing protein